jgi:hypothetical protein
LRVFYECDGTESFRFQLHVRRLDFYLHDQKRLSCLAIKMRRKLGPCWRGFTNCFFPIKLSCVWRPPNIPSQGGRKLPSLLAGRSQIDGKLTAYVCQNFTCSLPVTDWEALRRCWWSEAAPRPPCKEKRGYADYQMGCNLRLWDSNFASLLIAGIIANRLPLRSTRVSDSTRRRISTHRLAETTEDSPLPSYGCGVMRLLTELCLTLSGEPCKGLGWEMLVWMP